MKMLIIFNIGLVLCAALLSNDFLVYNSYVIYSLQFVGNIFYFFRNISYAKDFFLPSFFVMFYISVNLIFGSYLVPREYGWNKQFAETVTAIKNYNIIVPYMVLCNTMLSILTAHTLKKLEWQRRQKRLFGNQEQKISPDLSIVIKSAVYLLAFAVISYLDIFNTFSFLLAIMVIHLASYKVQASWFRYALYAAYLLLMVVFSFENKREVAVALFLILFVEAHFRQTPFRLSMGMLLRYAAVGVVFMALIVIASILRGYGAVPASTMVEAILLVPQYLSSDTFIDGITDNLELNYNYGVAVAAVDHVLNGHIPYQLGASIIKVLFLPFPRDLVFWKPESVMQIFTQVYAPSWWAEDGSMPVNIYAEMFVNFHFGGVIACGLLMAVLNFMYGYFEKADARSFSANTCLFFVIIVLFYARGSGLELYLLYYLFATPVLALYAALRFMSRPALARGSLQG